MTCVASAAEASASARARVDDWKVRRPATRETREATVRNMIINKKFDRDGLKGTLDGSQALPVKDQT